LSECLRMFAVEVALEKDLLVPLMSQMRLWLDQRRIEPSSFRYRGGSPLATVRVGFKVEGEASDFAEHFGGPVRRVAQAELLAAL
jgi:hypothetical protein